MKEVCFINSLGYEAFKGRSVGGTQLQLYYLSTELAEDQDYNVYFLARDAKDEEEIENVVFFEALSRVKGIKNKIKSGIKLMKKMYDVNADVYFSSSSNMEIALISLYCKLKRKKHVHRTNHERQMKKSRFRNELVKGLINHLGMRKTDLIFTQCKDHAEMLSNWFEPELEILPNSFPIPEGEISEEDFILWVGRRVEWKRPDLVLDLAEEFPEEDFVVISPRTSSTEQFYNRIERRAEEINNINLIERVPRDQIQEYFDNAKIFLNTSENEGFPNTFVEAGIGYTPILSYKVDPDSFIQLEDCGFSCSGDYQELKLRLEDMLENEDERRRKGRNCREYVEKNHDITNNIQTVKAVIERLLES